MSDQSILASVKAEQKAAMKARDKERLATIRLIQAEFKRIEVDERVEVDDARALAVLDKMVKQRRDSAQQYLDAGRQDLADQENGEIAVLQEFLPAQLGEDEINTLIDEAIAASGASGMQAMGAVMGQLKPKVQGRADMGAVSALVKARLAS
ncbi:GatB/YqeY domain-containing protein [Mangrovimicrobium sediminis]|uniref:GatB/YqeY domain-containing protein n=1 Tax=Mangrovimicrobium sediminis TaxID=2562682 RepID=A0A4Z0LZ85_9GAMM|nr:GatB/YqeY domain-containing protein [Haliea sp. SAOS-164]TGD72496.1 GatB/YqeY domain-containing protein [Haliea sp. SAOS-164]